MIQIVFVEPENPGNIGALARVMKNFGFNKLILINPKCDYLAQDARNRAKHANDVLEKAKIIKSIKDLKADCIVGTTAKLGTDYNVPRIPLSPKQFAESVVNLKNDVALLIGRESQGLLNNEIALCDFIVNIPSSKQYPTLNAVSAATVLLYELFIAFNKKDIHSKFRAASEADKAQIMKLLDISLSKMDFATEEKKNTQRKVWKKLISKSFMTGREAFALMGFLKKIR
jgi:tRNA/rRNA methyltransferase